ncbi:MAG: phytanoyl-CoA dioxygenase, partial [Chloroflexi bacterium]|nr:phytanoyl-CoA dioxygenase [Chloroflexota bacterium]
LGTTPVAIARNIATAHQRLDEDGYLYLPGYLLRDEVLAARHELCSQLAEHGLIRSDHPVDDAILVPGATLGVKSSDIARDNRALQHLLYATDGPMIRFYRTLFGEEVRHFDFTWLRLVKPGMGTASHCDLVFMGRGTHQLCTSWTPLGDIDRHLGGLIVLEGSHRQHDLTGDYLATDVDTVCENRHDGAWTGPDGFNMVLVHASLDNQSADRLRLSSDSRYQRASEPADERWIGIDPPAHGPQSARPVIC